MSWWTNWGRTALEVAGVAAGGYFAGPAIMGALGGSTAGAGAALADPALDAGLAGSGVVDSAAASGASLASAAPAVGSVGSSITAAAPYALGAAQLAGGVGNAAAQYFGQQQTNAANAQQAAQQEAFQASQTGTAYQRATADMKAAGLNPMLAYQQGGAASGAGAQATMGNAIGAGASGAMSGLNQMIQMDQMGANIEKTRADAANVTSNTNLNGLVGLKMAQDTTTSAATAKELQSRIELQAAQAAATEADRQRTESETNYNILSTPGRVATANQTPYLLRQQEATDQQRQYLINAQAINERNRIPGTTNQAEFDTSTGIAAPALHLFGDVISGANSARRFFGH